MVDSKIELIYNMKYVGVCPAYSSKFLIFNFNGVLQNG